MYFVICLNTGKIFKFDVNCVKRHSEVYGFLSVHEMLIIEFKSGAYLKIPFSNVVYYGVSED